MRSQTNQIIETLKRYAKGRQNDVHRGLESPELSALLLEKYAVGLVDAIRVLGVDVDINLIASEADKLCLCIDHDMNKNREIRYKNFSNLDLSEPRKYSRNLKRGFKCR
ncbi:hypothetical protein [Psychromonas sp. KJ10-2]|uniref:hypothetical protein n=1 Tax=Psychromonas sp. KJ10-2 TaxID=3391822 RepID=UPI0039B47130